MLTEDDVIDAVCSHLAAAGWVIKQRLTTQQTGIDIVAELPHGGRQLLVEAKGGTSSKKHTMRYGQPFSGNQARSHVAVAMYAAAQLLGKWPDHHVALAFPDDENHRLRVEAIQSALDTLGLTVFFVSTDRSVRAAGAALPRS